MNLGGIYIDVLQPNAARSVIQEALLIGKQLNDQYIVSKAERGLQAVEAEAANAAHTGRLLRA
jgi:hypothetical protein